VQLTGQSDEQHGLLQKLSAVERDVAAFFASLSPEEWDQRVGSAWTPAEHLDHLNIAVSAVARGFAVPRLLLRLRFGKAHRASRPYEDLRADYRGRLAAGAGASGHFVPAANRSEGASHHAHLLARWHRANERLREALRRWPDRDLDRIQLPHPILGKITAREMVFFTIYHGGHHAAAARSRLDRFNDSSRGGGPPVNEKGDSR
jgi:hypothetical protein